MTASEDALSMDHLGALIRPATKMDARTGTYWEAVCLAHEYWSSPCSKHEAGNRANAHNRVKHATGTRSEADHRPGDVDE